MNNPTAHKILFILGNGFDLDLNLKTSYYDFLDSHYFKNNTTPFFSRNSLDMSKSEINIFDYLKYKNDINGWIDVEKELANLASRKVRMNFGRDEVYAVVSEKERLSRNLELPFVTT